MSKSEAWAITAAILLVVFAIPAKVFRWAFLGDAALLFLLASLCAKAEATGADT